MHKTLQTYLVKTIVVLSITFGLHILFLKINNLPLFDNKIILSYVLNTVIAIAIFTFLFALRHKFKNQIGFLFLFGSFLKFGLFFVVFRPIYSEDGNVSSLEFLAFFVPYIINLFLETSSLTKWLNKSN